MFHYTQQKHFKCHILNNLVMLLHAGLLQLDTKNQSSVIGRQTLNCTIASLILVLFILLFKSFSWVLFICSLLKSKSFAVDPNPNLK